MAQAAKVKTTAKKASKAVAKKASAKKAVVKKTATKKSPVRKVVAKKTAKPRKAAAKVEAKVESKAAELFADFQAKAEQAAVVGKKAGLAYLGMYGKAYDFAKDQYAKAVEAQEANFAALVKRGEVVQDDAKARIDDFDLPEFELPAMDAESVKGRMKARVTAIKSQVETAKDKTEELVDVATTKLDELKDKMMPTSA